MALYWKVSLVFLAAALIFTFFRHLWLLLVRTSHMNERCCYYCQALSSEIGFESQTITINTQTPGKCFNFFAWALWFFTKWFSPMKICKSRRRCENYLYCLCSQFVVVIRDSIFSKILLPRAQCISFYDFLCINKCFSSLFGYFFQIRFYFCAKIYTFLSRRHTWVTTNVVCEYLRVSTWLLIGLQKKIGTFTVLPCSNIDKKLVHNQGNCQALNSV